MEIKTWEHRQTLFPDVSNIDEKEVQKKLEQYQKLKIAIIKHYGWEELNASQIEEALCAQVLESENKYGYSLDDIILKEYTTRYLEKLDYPVQTLCSLAPSKTSLQNFQHLFELRTMINKAHRLQIEESFNKYFCKLEGNNFINLLSGKSVTLLPNNPLTVIANKKEMFTMEIGQNTAIRPNLVGKFYSPDSCFDLDVWKDYAKFCEDTIQQIEILENGVDPKENGKTSLERNLEIYKTFAIGYKLENTYEIGDPNKTK